MIRTISFILTGNMASAVMMMVRTLLVSRLISLQDFGIASVLVLTLAMIEMMSALALHQQMIQAPDGDAERFQAGLQGFSVLRGIVNALALFVLARPMAWLFDIPDLSWAFQLMAIVPLVCGFMHFDMHRLSRKMQFRAVVFVALVPPAGSLLAVLPFYVFFKDYRVLLFALLLQNILTVAASHLCAQRPYRLLFDAAVMRRSVSFGWPVMVSGGLLFAIFNAERAIIGVHMGLDALALFSMALSLTLTPALVILRATMSFFLPLLSTTENRRQLVIATLQAHLLFGGALAATVTVLGGAFLNAVLGTKYAEAVPLIAWLGILQAFRVFAGGCAVTALSIAQTKNDMLANLARVALLPVAWFWVSKGGDIISVIWLGILGEACGFAIGLALTQKQHRLNLRPIALPLGISLGVLGLCTIDSRSVLDWMLPCVLIALLLLSVALMSDLRQQFRGAAVKGYAA